MKKNGKEILDRPVFTRLLFSQCWEDPRVAAGALRVSPGNVIISVTSGGCNTLSLALLNPSRILSIDLSDAQSWLLELKIAGIRVLSYAAYMEFLGARPSLRRLALYDICRPELSPQARRYWDNQGGMIEGGLLWAGRYERYLAAFRLFLSILQGRRKIEQLFECSTPEERKRFYEQKWNTRAWRLFFRVFFSRLVLGRAGLDPDFFTYVDGIREFGQHFRSRARHALVDLPTADNYFLAQICLGRYLNGRALPPYLQAENFSALRQKVDCIEIVTGELEKVLTALPEASVDGFNLSNVFEWVSPEVFENMLREIHRISKPGARLCYWNLLVHRSHPASLNGLFTPERELAARLHFEDRSFVYSNFEVASVNKPAYDERNDHANQTTMAVSDSSLDPGRSGICHAGRPEHRYR